MIIRTLAVYLLIIILSLAGIAQRAELSIQTGHASDILLLAFSPDGKTLASADKNCKIILWDMETGGQMIDFYIEEKNTSVSALCFSSESGFLIAGTMSGDIFVFDILQSKMISQYSFDEPVTQIINCSKDSLFVIARNLYSYNLKQSKAALFSDSKTANITKLEDNKFRFMTWFGEVYDIVDGKLLRNPFSIIKPERLEKKMKNYEILSSNLNKKIENAKNNKQINRYNLRKQYSGNYFSKSHINHSLFTQGEKLYLIRANSRISGYSLPEEKLCLIRSEMYFDERFTSLSYSRKSKTLLASNTDGKIYVIDETTGRIKKYLKEHLSNVNYVIYSPDEKFFASAGSDRSILIWDSGTLEPVRRLYSRAFPITSLSVSDDEKKIFFGDEIGFVKSIDIESILPGITSAKPHTSTVPLILYNENDSSVITAGCDNKVRKLSSEYLVVIKKSHFRRIVQANLIVTNILDLFGIYTPEKCLLDSISQSNSTGEISICGGRYRKGKKNFAAFNVSFDINTLRKTNTVKKGKKLITKPLINAQFPDIEMFAQYGIDFLNSANGHTNSLTGIKLLSRKNMLITTSLDATIKFWDLNSRSLLLTLIPIDKNKLVKITAENYYHAPRNALTAIGFKYGLNFYPPEQFDIQFNRPDKVIGALGNADAGIEKAYEAAYHKRLKKLQVDPAIFATEFHAPEVEVENISDSIFNSKEALLKIKATDTRYKVNRINVFNNDVPCYGAKGIDVSGKESASIVINTGVKLISGKNKLQISCMNEKGVESLKKTFEIVNQNKPEKPVLYIVSIGVSKYSDSLYNLNYASKDAQDIISAFESNKTSFREVRAKLITDNKATRENIKSLKNFLSSSGPEDVVIVFIAGHGLLDKNFDYYFGTHDINFSEPGARGIEYSEIESLLDSIPAMRKVLFMDTCHSGEADKDEIELTSQNVVTETGNIKFRSTGTGVKRKESLGLYRTNEIMKEMFADFRKGTGSTVISSSGAAEFSFEGRDWNNGLYTYCLLKGLREREADMNNDKIILLSELQEYINKKVNELSGGLQIPGSRTENPSMDFRIW